MVYWVHECFIHFDIKVETGNQLMVKKKIFLSFVTLKKGTKKIRQSSHKKIQEKIPNPKMTFEKLVFEAQYPVPKKGHRLIQL